MNISELLNNTARNDSHSNSTRCGVICHPVTPTEWVATQLPTITFGSVMTGTQLFNLLIFAFWRNKEPYITLHVALAVTSLFAGLSVLCTVPLRYQPLDVSIPLERFFGVALVLYMNCSGLLANLLISVDRWLSVEFPIKYRALVTHRKTRMAAIIGSFVASLAVVGPGLVVYWDRIIVDPCSRRKLFLPGESVGARVWRVANGPVYLPLLFLSQLRILVIAASMRLQHRRDRFWNRKQVSTNVIDRQGRPEMSAVRLVWISLLASMAVVGFTLVTNIPSMTLYFMQSATISPNERRTVMYLNLVQHCVSPIIYMLFWPDFRKTVSSLGRRMGRLLVCC